MGATPGPLPQVRKAVRSHVACLVSSRNTKLGDAPIEGRWRAIPLGLLGIGIALRLLAIVHIPVASDAAEYTVLAQSILEGRGMWLPWGEAWEMTAWVPGPSHHYPPAYPIFLVPFVAAIGFTSIVPQLASLAAGLGLLAVFHRATADLFGRAKALWFVGFLAIDPVLVVTTGTGYAENLVTLLFLVTVAAILKSLSRPRWILVAGAAAGLAYLTKSSVGPFFLIAGMAGFAWRFRFVGWSVLRDRAYLAAIGIFGAFAGGWAARNVLTFWDGSAEGLFTAWQSSAWFARATEAALADPLDLMGILALRLPFFAALFLLVAGPWWRELRGLPLRTDESSSALGLAVGLTYVLAWLISGVLWVLERSPILWADMSRYVVFANPVVWWMAAKGGDLRSPSFRRRSVVAAAVLLAMNAAAFVMPQGGVFEAYGALRDRTREGDVIALDHVPKYEAMLHLVGTGVVLEPYRDGVAAEYVLTTNVTRGYEGYRLLDVYGEGNGTEAMPSFPAALWIRADRVDGPGTGKRESGPRAGSEI